MEDAPGAKAAVQANNKRLSAPPRRSVFPRRLSVPINSAEYLNPCAMFTHLTSGFTLRSGCYIAGIYLVASSTLGMGLYGLALPIPRCPPGNSNCTITAYTYFFNDVATTGVVEILTVSGFLISFVGGFILLVATSMVKDVVCLIAVLVLLIGFVVHLVAVVVASIVAYKTEMKVKMDELRGGVVTQIWALVFLFDTIYLYCLWCAACLHLQIKRGYFAMLTTKPIVVPRLVPQARMSGE